MRILGIYFMFALALDHSHSHDAPLIRFEELEARGAAHLGLLDRALLLGLLHELVLRADELLARGALALERGLGSLDARDVLPVLLVRAERPVPPAERGREVVRERHVVEVVVLGARPEGDELVERPGEVWEGRSV